MARAVNLNCQAQKKENKMSKHYPPNFMEQQFNCVHCGVYAKQNWERLVYDEEWYINSSYLLCICEHCDKISLWKDETETILDPMATIHLPPHEDMPEKIKSLYNEALDYCRVIGNNAVHPNEINLDDTPEMVHTMFEMINFIVEEKIAKPKRIKDMFNKLP